MEPSISIRHLDLSFGAVDVLKDLNLDIGKGEFLVLLGSSGCGKSTLLNCVAGLLDVSDGQIFISGRNVTWEEPSKRGIGMVFQSYALYPQMTVEGNLTFGLKNAGMPRAEIAERVERAARILQIEPLLKRKPAALSGGQRQRVAIGRALVRDVDVFLFDEPLSNLDAKLRTDLRAEIKELHQTLGNTMIYVTHDQIEAMTLADRIAIMRGGLILQLDSPKEIYNRPANKYVAGFIGSPSMNFFEGVVDLGGAPVFSCEAGDFDLSGYEFGAAGPQGGPAWLGIRPEHIAHGPDAAACPVRMEATVRLVEPLGSDTLARVQVGERLLWIRLDGQSSIRPGDTLTIGWHAERANLFDSATENRI
ncbi:ABC transporter ATP-binding protein [Paracoccus sp. 1_MG-2023]|uniref:ABC transporter ATP-binding protein n=1 Tax=unclassified Paracoccus (in: a-proteobacteria) TaxID=2688777 RepID=UPI001C0A0DB3|nr:MULTISPECIES: ABC transporter ATP-binding protein [unclassified Paracoccus (in: a-proteobacteria)]MBU2957980.1 ABC transporter ATP-binding protein [Paracoccus sp. C2R09]MDO6668826.1 ABC transporter ATP-binding protein [Paracoccus sp. 1_MG-2023]